MRIAVFSPNRRSAQLLATRALELGYEVSALIGPTEELPMRHDNLTTIPGTLQDTDSIRKTLQGAHAVVSVIEDADDPSGQGIDNITRAMQERDIHRLVVSLGEKTDASTVRASHLDWTIIRPLDLFQRLQTRQRTPGHFASNLQETSESVSTNFIVGQITDSAYLHQSIALSR